METIIVEISDFKISKYPNILVTYALGSCIGTCIYDKNLKIGGLSHILLPKNPSDGNSFKDCYKYADTSILNMVKMLERHSCKRDSMVAKIAGGAEMFKFLSNNNDNKFTNIGNRNVEAVEKVLNQLKIPIISRDVGSNYGRTMFFYLNDGSVKIKNAHGLEKSL